MIFYWLLELVMFPVTLVLNILYGMVGWLVF